MRKLKILLLCLVMLIGIVGIVSTVNASPCCIIRILDVLQTEDQITISYNVYVNPGEARDIAVSIDCDKTGINIHDDIIEDVTEGEHTYTIDSSYFVEGNSYRIDMAFWGYCQWGVCMDADPYVFECTSGIPCFEYEDLDNGKINLKGQTTAAVNVKATDAGFYSVSFNSEEGAYVTVYSYPEYYYCGSIKSFYFEENEQKTYLISSEDSDDLKATFIFKKTDIYIPGNQNPQLEDDGVCFEISNKYGLNKIEIIKEGVYVFCQDSEKAQYMNILKSDGSTFMGINRAQKTSVMFEKTGTYYIDTSSVDAEYTLTIKYDVPDALEFDREYTFSENQRSYYMLNLQQPALLTYHSPYASAEIRSGNNIYNFYDNGQSIVAPAGEYYVIFYTYSGGSRASFSCQNLVSAELDTPVTPNLQSQWSYCFAFKAPKDGKYEFDFSNTTDNAYIEGIGINEESKSLNYHVTEIKKDQWVLVKISSQVEVTVREYNEPEAVDLTFGEPSYFEYKSGKTYLYKYVPTRDEIYKISSSKCFCRGVKIYTDSEVLYETTSSQNIFSHEINLREGVTVYIELKGLHNISPEDKANHIILSSPYIDIEESASVIVTQNDTVKVRYRAKESGYHMVGLEKLGGSWQYVSFDFGDGYDFLLYDTNSQVVYVEEGKDLVICLDGYSGYSQCNINIEISMLLAESININTDYTIEPNKYYSFTPSDDGLHEIQTSDWLSLNIMDTKDRYLGLSTSSNKTIFSAKAGVTYIICLASSDSGTINISYADVPKFNLNTEVASTIDGDVYEIEIEEEGIYKVNSDLCNATVYISVDGWQEVPLAEVFELKEGKYYIATHHDQVSDEFYEPYTKFSVVKNTTTAELGIKLIDFVYEIPYDSASAIVVVTAPYGTEDVTVGVEYTNDGTGINTSSSHQVMTCLEDKITSIDTYDITLGETYTIRPFVYLNDEKNKIYGEEKQMTANIYDLVQIKHNTYEEDIISNKKTVQYIDGYENTRVYEFTQPEGDTGTVNIELSVFNYIRLYDENFEYVSGESNGSTYQYELEGGKKYYIVADVYNDGMARVNISSLSDVPQILPYQITGARKTVDGITFMVEGKGEHTALYTAIYDDYDTLIEFAELENPVGKKSIKFENINNAKYGRIMLTDFDSFAPLCESVEITF